MTEKDICQWLKNRKINDYFNIEINQRELFSDKNEKVCTTLNQIEDFLILVFAVTVFISMSAFASLVDISKRIISFTVELNICAITVTIKNY